MSKRRALEIIGELEIDIETVEAERLLTELRKIIEEEMWDIEKIGNRKAMMLYLVVPQGMKW